MKTWDINKHSVILRDEFEFVSEIIMNDVLKYNGDLVNVNGHNIHIFRPGNISKPKILLMSGSGTIAPVYDFKVLYEKLSKSFRIIVMEKFGYGYSDIFDSPADIDTLVSIQRKALETTNNKANILAKYFK